ncbi:MOSC domain-containing protein [Deinococcus psychrotolerans]|uniref:MOSC domain-containing protein n=1 Tax=Deinococcus psychrotolerans TaxID=2489213 RepID=A0A3G8Y7W6_9DEIO|nr:MOSC domain-containing protein [Deinococcus psychrotolerans]AZI41472.1 MOSC domain-containing protein [Deinococcus psychrotolerans]
MQLLSVNIGQPEPIAAKDGQSGIFKRPTAQPVHIGRLGLAGDHIQDTKHHGGPDQAVYVYTQPDYEHWAALLGTELAAGTFGENLLISELESASLPIGTQLRVGAALLEITSARIPCGTLAARMDDPKFVKTFRRVRRPGFYARVLEEGAVSAGDAVTLERQLAGDAPSVLDTFEFFYAKAPTRPQMERLLSAPIHHKMRSELETLLAKL